MTEKISPVDMIVDAFNQRTFHFVDLAQRLYDSGVRTTDLKLMPGLPPAYSNDLFNLLWHLERENGLFDTHIEIAKRDCISARTQKRMKIAFEKNKNRNTTG